MTKPSRRNFCLSVTASAAVVTGLTSRKLNIGVAEAGNPLQSRKPFAWPTPEATRLIAAAETQVGKTIGYDGSYVALQYPMGDIPRQIGVCTDVVIRAYRDAFGIDLQRQIHEDMKLAFSSYPNIWGLKRPDRNIDHRRVPNMERFFARKNARLDIGSLGSDFRPGDLVSQRLPNNLPHIGIVSHFASRDGKRPLVIHNIGNGTQIEDRLFDFRIVGHFRYLPQTG